MDNFFQDNEDLLYYFENGLDWPTLIKFSENNYHVEGGFKSSGEAMDSYHTTLDTLGQLAASFHSPQPEPINPQKKSDEFIKMLANWGFHGMCLPRELGGMGLPYLMYFCQSELLARADLELFNRQKKYSVMTHALLNYSIYEGTTTYKLNPLAILSTRFSSEIQLISRGQASGVVHTDEVFLRNQLAKNQLQATKSSLDDWQISGEYADLDIDIGEYHFVLARSENLVDQEKAVASDFSLFLLTVPEKLPFSGGQDQLKAQLIGIRGAGLKMLQLLTNFTQINSGFAAIGAMQACFQLAYDFAQKRLAVPRGIYDHEMISAYLDEMKVLIKSTRALAMKCAFHEEISQRLKVLLQSGGLDLEETKLANKRLNLHSACARSLTPLLKFSCAENAVEVAKLSMRVSGFEENCLDPLAPHKQSKLKTIFDAMAYSSLDGDYLLMAKRATKDAILKVIKDPAGFAQDLARSKALSLASLSSPKRRVAAISLLTLQTLRHLVTAIMMSKVKDTKELPLSLWNKALFYDWNPKEDFTKAFLYAEPLTKMLVLREKAKILFDQKTKHPERKEILIQFLDLAEPLVHYLHRTIVLGTKDQVSGEDKIRKTAHLKPTQVNQNENPKNALPKADS